MAINKSRLFSITLYSDVIMEEYRLWQRFAASYKGNDLENFLPEREEFVNWNERIVIYTKDNMVLYQSIMNRLFIDMKIQNEPFSPILCGAAEEFLEMTSMAIQFLIDSNHKIEYALRYLVGRIIIVDCDELVACSSPLFLGLIILSPKKNWVIVDYIENLIHEMSHIELYIKQLVDPLIIKGSYLKSPFRKQLRPASGVYHAAFVLARIIMLMEPLIRNSPHVFYIKERVDACRLALVKTLPQFSGNDILTPAGNLIFSEMNLIATHPFDCVSHTSTYVDSYRPN